MSHLTDPVRFGKKIKVTLESGHANHPRDDRSTTAHWYRTLPGPKLEILPVASRLPRKPEIVPPAPDLSEVDILRLSLKRKRNWHNIERGMICSLRTATGGWSSGRRIRENER